MLPGVPCGCQVNYLFYVDRQRPPQKGGFFLLGAFDSGSKKIRYPVPLRGIQVKIRTFEPDSKQVREVTVIQDFLPQ